MEQPPHIRPCHRTGNCCRGRGSCTLTPDDVTAIADHLGLSVFDFRLRYTHDSPRGPVLKIRGGYAGDGSCIFLNDDAACAVQPVKPRQCREYPLWSQFVTDPAAFEQARRECGMIGHLSHEQFCEIYAVSQARMR